MTKLSAYFSEYSLIKYRCMIEVEYFIEVCIRGPQIIRVGAGRLVFPPRLCPARNRARSGCVDTPDCAHSYAGRSPSWRRFPPQNLTCAWRPRFKVPAALG